MNMGTANTTAETKETTSENTATPERLKENCSFNGCLMSCYLQYAP